MKLTSFYSEGELSSIRVSSAEDVVDGIKNLLFEEQIIEATLVSVSFGGRSIIQLCS